MPKFKISVSRDHKKYTIVVESDTLDQARERVHKEGYSILNVEIAENSDFNGKKYTFEGFRGNELKKGKVIGQDIFKIYLKLREGLGYEVKKLYSEEDEKLSDIQKENILKELEEQFDIYKNLKKRKEKNDIEQNQQEEQKKSKEEDSNIDNFYMKKELEDTYRLIDFVLLKLKNFIENSNLVGIDFAKKEKLKEIYNNIIKLKKSTNISKTKEICELALLKIGEIELENLEKNKTKESQKLLKDTNKLLRQVGSSKQFIEREKDINYIISSFIENVVLFIQKLKDKKQKKLEKNFIDTESHSYLKTLLLLHKYQEKLKENSGNIFKNTPIFLFPTGNNEKIRQDLLLKRRVIKQNIALLQAKRKGKVISITKIVKGYNKFIETLLNLFSYIKNYILYVILFYSLIFIILFNLSYFGIFSDTANSLNYNGVFFFLVFIFTYLAINYSKGLFTIIFNLAILSSIIIFGVVNF